MWIRWEFWEKVTLTQFDHFSKKVVKRGGANRHMKDLCLGEILRLVDLPLASASQHRLALVQRPSSGSGQALGERGGS